MQLLQLDPQLPVHVVSKNKPGMALGWIDYGQEADLIWITALNNGEVWCVPNHDVRLCWNYSVGRNKPEKEKTDG